ncbi:Type I site-specific restriction-modification system, R (restriction) subunit or related helicase [Halalkaliarchaeum sp. AArc-CO]|uniref:type I restriction endonuclease subunit R n=1 Tax=Halalkaliarchaeum sp. AArc-CO TaxID=2866381 RepID=UPI00217D9262|nr:type I restriction endonuclease subunit R [Halalkaliarchaeum sp. AArc-CO]UWG50711.1 Type I site-specific restriction-modification system, R (restriction) subunit or related helicase [Halalkaliarchaeum sp. AArc-CO]
MADPLPSEAGVEGSILQWLDSLGWETYGLDDGEGASHLDTEYDREASDVIYWNLLRERVKAINDDVDETNVDRFLNSLRRDLDTDDLMDGNRKFQKLLRTGKQFAAKHNNGTTKPTYVDLIDFADIENNHFVAANQFRVNRRKSIRPDVTLFVNGIPLVQMELKSLAQDNDFFDAISDLQSYEEQVPRLFVPGLLNVAADTTELRYGAVSASTEFYEPWTDAPPEYEDPNPMKQAVQALCNPQTLLNILDNFVFYERTAGGDAKIVPRHMQYYAVQRILRRVYDDDADRGLIWHTQGSGKSYTMLYAAKNLLERDVMGSPQVFIIVDTDKLASQMRDNLSNIGFERSEVAGSIEHLQQLIEEGKSQLVLTTIQKFQDVEPDSQGNDEVVVMSDEAHRFMEKDLGSRLDAALPNCYHFGFTGTPVHEGESELDRNTFREFSPDGEECLHRYSIKRGIEDDLIKPVFFTLWHDVEWDIDEAGMDERFDASFSDLPDEEKQEIIAESFTSRELGELQPRVEAYVEKLNEHFDEKVDANGWKGMVVTPSREAAALYGELLIEERDPSEVDVIYTSNEGDSERIRQFHTTSEERGRIVKRFREEDEPKLLVVHNMLLTGFDAPVLKTMYLDRNLKNHTLLQAIARTNRPAEGKTNGEIVDFQGVFRNVDEALQYDKETRDFAARDEEELFETLEDQLEDVLDLFEDIPKTDSQESLQACLARVSKHPEKREFKQGYRRLQNLYESVSPDGRLIESGIQAKYQWLTRVFVAFRRNNNRDENPEDDMREKTKKIVEDNVDVRDIKDRFPVYKIGEEHLEAVQDMDEPAAQASSIAHATKDHLHPRSNQNPRYKRLSERVTDLVERWQSGQMDDPAAVDALEQLEREVIEVEQEADERDLSDGAFAVFAELVDHHEELIGSERDAEELARDIYDAFESEVDTSFEGWHTNDGTLNAIEIAVIDVLVKDHDRADLVKADDFVENVRDYLIENAASSSGSL